jgi:hypothetical protein
MAAIMGTQPIALGLGAGAELRQPFGIAVVGGLLTSASDAVHHAGHLSVAGELAARCGERDRRPDSVGAVAIRPNRLPSAAPASIGRLVPA